jgi:hypothetical protein
VDSDSLAAAELLAALSRAAEILAGLGHPFVRSSPFTYFVPPAGVRTGTAFVLPDGREVRFAVSLTAADAVFRVEGVAESEGEALLDLPGRAAVDLRSALTVLDDYACELAGEARRLVDGLLDEIV